jgi:hypothetical protein
VDQVDYHTLEATTAAQARVVWYVRPTTNWQFVYPGDAPASGVVAPSPDGTATLAGGSSWRVTVFAINGTTPQLNADATPGPDVDGYNGAIGTQLGEFTWTADGTSTGAPSTLENTFSIALPMDIVNHLIPGPNYSTGTPHKFPFGAFARDGDAFQIPFIGAYVVVDSKTPTQIDALNSITMDAAYAEDGDSTDNARELIGKFYPLWDTASAVPNATWDYSPTDTANHHYSFARFLLDYIGAINTPNSDFLPNIPGVTTPEAGTTTTEAEDVPNNPSLQPAYPSAPTSANYTKVANHDPNSTTTYNNEYDQPNEGLININTAPWPVLAMLPMVMDANGNIDVVNNANLAKAIVAYRDRNGPFTSIIDLNNVVNYAGGAADMTHTFMNGWDTLNIGTAGGDPDANQRDFTGLATATAADFPRWPPVVPADTLPKNILQDDPKNALNMLTRISNLITTRSDSFTVYIVIEGWKNVGSTDTNNPPTRVSQVRQAYIIDRSQVNGLNKTPTIIPVPTN